ncbi:DEAD/DEAH box helicase [Bacillus tequilensis]|uniref:DEAD/DEAH box helicase n=1 Tax=Bacillus tequilensis TaxID=227866 RepID=UPI0004666024|nr:DEAD/DEAH box helicase [Bacillus tequilensis]MDR4436209.1 DEAD/DEAH box helicase [Bacillus tequilensis]SPU01152.1 SNF2 helicase associated domain-containing protein [Bacillus tequilensis]
MIEVSKFTNQDQDYLKIKLRKLDPEIVNIIMSIDGWGKAQEPMCYGLPYSALGEFFQKTKDYMVVWKSHADSMGTLARGIDTRDIPTEFIVDYEPKLPLREHQIVTFNLMLQRDFLLISDQEGVGKTPPILCQHDAKIQNGIAKWGLYVTKAGLIYDVKNQAEKFTHLNVVTIEGSAKQRIKKYELLERDDSVGLVVVSYETFRTDIQHFTSINKAKPFDIMYIDECHKIKNVNSSLGKLIHRIGPKQRYAITASPVINEIIDMYNMLYWMGAIQYNYFRFRNKFCELDGWGNVARYKNLWEIKTILQSNMLRRLKTDVLKDLPPVVSKPIYVEMTSPQRKLYKAIEKGDYEGIDFEDMFFEDVPSELAKHARLAQVAESAEIVGGDSGKKGSGKLVELENLLEEITDRGEKAIVFTRSKRMTHVMVDYFSQYNPSYITGDVDTQAKGNQDVSERQMMVDKFQEDDSCKVIICTESASREGWTGTKANNVIFTSKPWSPSYISQCIGRAWRFGQTGGATGSINVYSLISRGTIDERIEKLLEEKQFVIDSTVEQPLGTQKILSVLDGASA